MSHANKVVSPSCAWTSTTRFIQSCRPSRIWSWKVSEWSLSSIIILQHPVQKVCDNFVIFLPGSLPSWHIRGTWQEWYLWKKTQTNGSYPWMGALSCLDLCDLSGENYEETGSRRRKWGISLFLTLVVQGLWPLWIHSIYFPDHMKTTSQFTYLPDLPFIQMNRSSDMAYYLPFLSRFPIE